VEEESTHVVVNPISATPSLVEEESTHVVVNPISATSKESLFDRIAESP